MEEGDGGNYTCELQYGSRLVRRTTQLKVTGRKDVGTSAVFFSENAKIPLRTNQFLLRQGEHCFVSVPSDIHRVFVEKVQFLSEIHQINVDGDEGLFFGLRQVKQMEEVHDLNTQPCSEFPPH